MNKTLQEGLDYVKELLAFLDALQPQFHTFVIPPHTSLWPIREATRGTRLFLGAQNMHWAEAGAFTGEISPTMLQEMGIDLVELGHSERRQYYNENDYDLNKKIRAAIRHGIRPLLCVGESLTERQFGVETEVVASQLKISLHGVSSHEAAQLLIAYEPVWAIGEAGKPAEPAQIARMHAHIRDLLCSLFGDSGRRIPILYGGSVNQENFLTYLRIKEVNGLFIGRAAWDLASFRQMLQEIHRYALAEM